MTQRYICHNRHSKKGELQQTNRLETLSGGEGGGHGGLTHFTLSQLRPNFFIKPVEVNVNFPHSSSMCTLVCKRAMETLTKLKTAEVSRLLGQTS